MLTIEQFDRARHLEPASMLLAGRQRRDRQRDPRLPIAYEVPAACRPLIEQALDQAGAFGVVAKEGADVRGYAIGTTQLIPQTHFLSSFFPVRGASISFPAHATAEGAEYDVYREMYGVLAEHFVSLGFFDHSINLPASDRDARDAWSSLGFGMSMCAALRDASPPERPTASVEMHQAAQEDAEIVYRLSEELTLHHARSPIFNPFIREGDASGHEMQFGLLAQPDDNAHWVAYQDGRPLGMNTFMPPSFMAQMTVPEKTVYLFQGIVTQDARTGGVGTAILSKGTEWARAKGYDYIGLHFATANLSGAKFWQSSGFKPVEYGMRRRIDDRIAWANR
jgi:GNAT superfamily N-acetyltransferase